MSQENLETARRMVALLNEQGAEEAIEALSDLYHPDAEAHDRQPAPGMPSNMQGRATIIAVTKQWMEVLDNWKIEVHEYVDADPWVVADVHWHAIGKGSDIPIDWRVVEAHKLQDGKVVRSLWGLPDVAAALEAVGLSESATSPGNVEIVRSIHTGWERGDYSSTEALDPDIEYVVADGPEPGAGKGLPGLGRAWVAWMSAWEDLRIEVDEYRALDDERVLVLARKIGRGKQSGLEIDDMHAKGATICHVRGGRVTRMVLYYDRKRAFADLGLSE